MRFVLHGIFHDGLDPVLELLRHLLELLVPCDDLVVVPPAAATVRGSLLLSLGQDNADVVLGVGVDSSRGSSR